MHGFHGCYWRFDLSTGRGARVAIPPSVLRSYLGGVGLGSWLLYREAPEGVDPLAPEAPLVFAFSPLVGTPLTTSAKFAVVAKSPLTGLLCDALSSSHFAIAGKRMGVDAIDYDRSGRPDLIIGHFSSEMMALYHNEGNGLVIDEGPRTAVGRASLLSLTFGCFFFDFDLDGWPDIFAANGHVADDVERVQSRVTYAQRPQLFHNLGQGNFEEIVVSDGSALQTPMVGRGAAYADADNDGDLDVLVTANGGPARLLRNDGGSANHVLRVRTVGTVSNRDGIGARVEVTAGGDTRYQTVKTGSSYLSQSELTLTFGLGPATTLSTVSVAWPSGQVDTLDDVDADQTITIEEGAGLVETTPIDVRR